MTSVVGITLGARVTVVPGRIAAWNLVMVIGAGSETATGTGPCWTIVDSGAVEAIPLPEKVGPELEGFT